MEKLEKKVRTRFAPSPTGYMHVGNLRTALFAYLFAKHYDGDFVLRIEDTDQKRYVEGATDIIYSTLKQTGLIHDEGPDIGGNYGPYVQSERKHLYKPYAEELVKKGHAYYCFCNKEEEDASENDDEEPSEKVYGHHCNCANLSQAEVEAKIASGASYVIRQKMPKDTIVVVHDEVYGDITVNTDTLDEQVLIKSDGMPTYNFANVVDDHLMDITHVIRGKEYVSSAPKYQLLYDGLGWESPKTIHVSTILGKNADGSVSKLSKRHGSVSFNNLVEQGYLPEALMNYIALLGWSPKQEREIFTLAELASLFTADGIVKNDAVLDYQKLDWMNGMYIRALSLDELAKHVLPLIEKELPAYVNKEKLLAVLQPRLEKFNDAVDKIEFIKPFSKVTEENYYQNKYKLDRPMVINILEKVIPTLTGVNAWNNEELFNVLKPLGEELAVKPAAVMWVVRIALGNQIVTPGSATELLEIFGKEESLNRLNKALNELK